MMNQNQCHDQVSFRLYIAACRAAWVSQIWAKLQGQPRRLRDLTAIAASGVVGDRRAAGTHAVPIGQICGSEGRCADFDRAFRPLKGHTQDRWLSVARGYLAGRSLPPDARVADAGMATVPAGRQCFGEPSETGFRRMGKGRAG